MHTQAFHFVQTTLATYEPRPRAKVLEIGSYDVNSSAREMLIRTLLPGRSYYGIDVRAGPGVDEAIDCADYDGGQAFDFVISTEVMEHMARPKTLIACAWRSLKPGGRLILTAAGPGRWPHGSDGGAVGTEHYGNIDPGILVDWLDDWQNVQIEHNQAARDVYATAVKPEES